MDPRRIASIMAVVGGVGWFAKVGLIWLDGGETTSGGPVGLTYVVGLAAMAIALGAAGYTLVEKAPVWLRGIVAVAVPLLVLMLWMMLDEAIKAVYTGNSWFRDEASVLVAATIAVGMGLWGFGKHRPVVEPTYKSHAAPHRGRRAAR